MAGFASIDPATPLGSAAPNTIHTIFQTLKGDILDGLRGADSPVPKSGLHDGTGTADWQGMLVTETRTNDPTYTDRPEKYVFIRQQAQSGSGDTESSRWRRRTSTGWTNVGIWVKQILGLFVAEEGTYASEWQAIVVNTKTHVRTQLATFTAGTDSPKFFPLIDVDYTGLNTPNFVFSAPTDPIEGAATSTATTDGNIFVWITKSTTDGKYYLDLYNDTVNNESVNVAVGRFMWN